MTRPGTRIRNPRREFASLPVYDQVNFSPIIMQPKAWWDASDTTTITASSGAVSQWNDKSGNGYNLTQATGSAQPTTNLNTRNGLNVLRFDGGDVMNYSGTTGMNVGTMTVLGVFEETTTVDNAGFFAAHANAGNDYDRTDAVCTASVTGTDWFETVRRFVTATDGSARIAGSGATPFSVWTSVWTTGTLTARRNRQTSTVTTQTATWGTANGGFIIGGRYINGAVSASFRLNGNMAEMIVFDRELTFSEYNYLTQYLMGKWGIAPT